jgi:hypothetical protein
MASAPLAPLSTQQRANLEALADDLGRIFGARLQSLVAYRLTAAPAADGLVRTLALLDQLTFDDLHKCVPLASGWHRRGLAVPLLLTHHEFFRTLDVFPLEYGHIIASHVVIAGSNPFEGADVADADRRRACEHQAKSHLIHLREGFLETEGDASEVAQLIAASVPSFRALLTNIANLEGVGTADVPDEQLGGIAERTIGIQASLVAEVLEAPVAMGTVADPTALLARYIDGSERIWRFVDGWRS